MIELWLLISIMVLVAIGFVVYPFWFAHKEEASPTSRNLNRQLYQDKFKDLDQKLNTGLLTDSEYEQTKLELEQALLQDVSVLTDSVTGKKNGNRMYLIPILLSLLIAISSVSIYQGFGYSHQLKLYHLIQERTAEFKKTGSPNEVIQLLEAKLKQQPNSAQGWYLLGKLYISDQQYSKAVIALQKANQLNPKQEVIMVKYAEALFFTHDQILNSKARSLLADALDQDKDNLEAINLLAIDAFHQLLIN